MSETTHQAWTEVNQTREQRLKDWRGDLSLEQRLAQLEAKFLEEDDRLYNVVLPEIDEQIDRAIIQSCDTDNKADKRYQQSVREVHDAKTRLEQSIQETLAETIKELLSSSNATVVVNALREALKSTVLITRQANRGELGNVGVLVTRSATQAELRAVSSESHHD